MRIDEAAAKGAFGFWIVGGDSQLHRQLAPLLSPRGWGGIQETAFGHFEIREGSPGTEPKEEEPETD